MDSEVFAAWFGLIRGLTHAQRQRGFEGLALAEAGADAGSGGLTLPVIADARAVSGATASADCDMPPTVDPVLAAAQR